MKTIRLAALLLAAILLAPWPAAAQGVRVITTCGTLASPLPVGSTGQPLFMDITGTLCTSSTGGGGGGGAVTVANGADVTQGAIADTASTAGGTGTLSAKLRLMTTQLGTLNTTLGSPFQAGGSIGNTTFAATQGTSPWIVAGGGTAGSAATGVVTVQGIASATPIIAAISNAGVTVVTQRADTADAVAASATANNFAVINRNTVFNGTTWDRLPGSTLGGYSILRDAAGNARGANVNASNQLSTSCDSASCATVTTWAGGTLGAMANYGTSPGAVLVPGANVFVTNTNANGSATSANSSPVVIASDQVAVAIKAASGVFASGAFASGSYASGAFASGSIASGALASGSIAAGAIAAGATSIAENEDVASADGDRGVKVLAVRKATPANTSGTDGDYEFPQISAGSLWVASVATNKTMVSERVINGGSVYETVAASQTGQTLGATGATGDYLSHCVIYPTSTTPGVVTVFDNSSAAGSNVIAFPGGASSVSNLAPIAIPVGAISTAGPWKATTGANLVLTCYGWFTP